MVDPLCKLQDGYELIGIGLTNGNSTPFVKRRFLILQNQR